MTKMSTTYLGNLRTEITHLQSGEKIITDAPIDNKGKGEYFSPTDMFSSSLASCMLTIIGISAQEHGFSIDGTYVNTEKIMASNPRRVAELILDVYLPSDEYSPKERRLIESAAKTCPVANSISPDIIKRITFHYQKKR